MNRYAFPSSGDPEKVISDRGVAFRHLSYDRVVHKIIGLGP